MCICGHVSQSTPPHAWGPRADALAICFPGVRFWPRGLGGQAAGTALLWGYAAIIYTQLFSQNEIVV